MICNFFFKEKNNFEEKEVILTSLKEKGPIYGI